jgi:hypothetical protein
MVTAATRSCALRTRDAPIPDWMALAALGLLLSRCVPLSRQVLAYPPRSQTSEEVRVDTAVCEAWAKGTAAATGAVVGGAVMAGIGTVAGAASSAAVGHPDPGPRAGIEPAEGLYGTVGGAGSTSESAAQRQQRAYAACMVPAGTPWRRRAAAGGRRDLTPRSPGQAPAVAAPGRRAAGPGSLRPPSHTAEADRPRRPGVTETRGESPMSMRVTGTRVAGPAIPLPGGGFSVTVRSRWWAVSAARMRASMAGLPMIGDWRTYKAGPHELNTDLLQKLHVSVQSPQTIESVDPQKMTVAECVLFFVGKLSKDSLIGSFQPLTVHTPDGKYVIHGDRFCLNVLSLLLDLYKSHGMDGFASTWFFYGRDEAPDGIGTRHYFFVVSSDDRIIEPKASLFEFSDSSFRREVLTPLGKSEYQFWRTHAAALARLWYPRFYEQTIPGQLMVVRPDKPRLFHYSRPVTSYSREIKIALGIIAVLLLLRLLR